VLPITGGSCSEPANKKQKKEAQRRVQHVGVQGPFIKSGWSHIPITFSQEDLQLKDYPHNDAMVISYVIKGFLVHNVLVDTGSAADIIFAKAFRQMQEPEDKIHDATHPLCGFGGRQIVALGKITMPVTFGFVNNTRTEQVVFDIVDMEYPYNAIIGRGTLNAFEAILHPAYLCMKIPSDQEPIAIYGSQEAARKAEGNWTDSKAIHNIDEAEACEQYKYRREKAASADHQIWMKKEDEPKISFITPSGTYCYLRMPEGLKNAGGSFSRMTVKVLHSQIGRNVLTYVDDIIVKSTKQENHIADLQETFANFRQAGLKLNPEKCVFGVKKGKFLGCLVSTKGIEANPNKIEAILRMEPPSTKKGAQRLTGRLASLRVCLV
jgi:hypothetical protein